MKSPGRVTFWSRLVGLTRWADWSTGAVTMLFGLGFLAALAQRARFEFFAGRLALFLLFAAVHSALGYMVNNWGDCALDRAQGRANPFNAMPAWQGRISLAATGLAAFLTALPFLRGLGFVLAWFAWVFMMLAYSLPSLRLKTRGIWGLLASTVAQYTLPAILLFLAMNTARSAWAALLVVAVTIICLTLEIGHQRVDRAADAHAEAYTFATSQSPTRLDAIYAAALLLDVAAVAIFTGCAVAVLVSFGQFWMRALGIALGAGVLGLIVIVLSTEIRAARTGQPIDPHYGAVVHLPSKLLHETVSNAILPAVIGVGLTIFDPRYALLLVAFLFWRVVLYRPNWRLLYALLGREHA